MLKVAIVSEGPASAVVAGAGEPGTGSRLVELARALGSYEVAVRLFVRRDDPAIAADLNLGQEVTATTVPATPAQPDVADGSDVREFGDNLAASLREWSADVIHGLSWRAGLAVLLGSNTGTPLVHTFHGVDDRASRAIHDAATAGDGSRAAATRGGAGRGRDLTTAPAAASVTSDLSPLLRLERAVCHDAAHVLAGCSAHLDDLGRIGTPRSKVTVVPAGVDLKTFRPDAPALLPVDGMRVLCVGRRLDQHRFDLVIPVLRALPGVELVIAGGPPAEELSADAEAVRLTKLAERWDVAARVRLLGNVPPEAMPGLFASADIVVCAPRHHGVGQVALEAAACGRPVVATAVGGLTDMVLDGVTGILVPPDRPVSLAHAIRKLRADPIRLDGYGLAARERARARHSWTRIAQETADVYTSVAA